MAALKVAPYEGALDRDKEKESLTPSHLPISLLDRILQAEGRAVGTRH